MVAKNSGAVMDAVMNLGRLRNLGQTNPPLMSTNGVIGSRGKTKRNPRAAKIQSLVPVDGEEDHKKRALVRRGEIGLGEGAGSGLKLERNLKVE
jgi:hypothetical protein